MELVEFPEQTVVIAKDQPQYKPLPAHRFAGDPKGRIACCWALSLRERLLVAITGRLWHEVLTFNQALQPQLLSVRKPAMPPPRSQRVAVTINGRLLPRWCYRVDPYEGAVSIHLLGRIVMRILRKLPGRGLSHIEYPYEDAGTR